MQNPIGRWRDNKALSPFRDLTNIESSFDRFFNEMMHLKKDSNQDMAFSPSCEVTEDGTNYIFKFDMPGVKKENIHVEANNTTLTVRAEREEEKKQESKKKYVAEVLYGTYSRSFSFPSQLDEKQIKAKFENGVLTITLPKPTDNKSKEVSVQ